MAAAAVAPANGALTSPPPESPQSSMSATKRKRDVSDDGSTEANGTPDIKPLGHQGFLRNEKLLIRDFFDVLQRFDVNPPILKRPLPDLSAEDEPQAKRQKSDENNKPLNIAEKTSQDAYNVLDELVLDINEAVKDQIAELGRDDADEDSPSRAVAVTAVTKFGEKAHELFRREAKYPKAGSEGAREHRDVVECGADGSFVLTVFGNAPQGKHLFSSLERQQPARASKPLQEILLPNGLSTTRVIPAGPSEKSSRSLTLGELFPSPRGLLPLQPPKAPKSSTKGNVLSFYHPELTEKSKYRTNSYFSSNVSTGHWLDYSNATPTIPTKTKQRERAQSLAGRKPSTTELEMSEMEALFRGAFSSFAPSKDDSAAMVSSGQLSRMWWQRVGQRNFQKLIDLEKPVEETPESNDKSSGPPIDETIIQEAIESWDESLIDPSLEGAMGHKSEHDKDVDDVLQEVSDLIETLFSYQRNRHLTLPTSQDRYSADPVNGDMLRNASLAQQPSEEEMVTYEALKAQLTLIIKTLPPYAVARLNSDKLEELNVSTKIEIRTEEYKGVMEEDEQAARARQAAMQAAANSRPPPQRTPSVSSGSYPPHQYAPPYGTPSRTPMPNPQYYGQTPGRAQAPPPPHQRPPPGPAPPYPQQRPPQQQFRPNGYAGYTPQMAKPQAPFSHPNMQYPGTPTQPRMPQHPGYGQHAPPPQPPGTPQNRFPPGYPGQYGQHPQNMPVQHPSQPPYSPHMNGTPQHMQQRPMPPQGPGAPPHYTQSPQPSQARPQYGTPQGMPQGIPPNQAPPPRQYGAGSPGVPPTGLTGYHTVMPEVQQQRLMEQARARASAHERTLGFGEKVSQGGGAQPSGPPGSAGPGMGQVAGLAGIGLGAGNVDMAKLAAARANMPGGIGHSPSPKPQMGTTAGPPPPNGVAPPPPSASPASMPPSSVSPGPGGPFPRPPG